MAKEPTYLPKILKGISKANPWLTVLQTLLASKPTNVGEQEWLENRRHRQAVEKAQKYLAEPVQSTFTTGRAGSKYEYFPSGRTQRDRAPGHRDKQSGLQEESSTTVFTDGSERSVEAAENIASINASDIPTQLELIVDDKNVVKGIKLVHAENYGPKKRGEMIVQMPVTRLPGVGKQPIEILGESGRRLHVGSEIVKISKKGGGSIERNPHDYQPRAI